MPRHARIWRRLFIRLGLFVLAMNIVLISIPRCDMIFSVLHQALPAVDSGDTEIACHETDQPQDPQGPALTSQRICECSVYQFMAFHAPELNISEHVAFRVQSERVLSFPWKAHLTDFLPALEPPYPKV